MSKGDRNPDKIKRVVTDTERKAQKGTTMNETKMTNRDFLTAIINGKVTEDVVYNKQNPKKAKVNYTITLNEPYTYDSIEYRHFPAGADSLIKATENDCRLVVGEQFSVPNLTAERDRLNNLLRNNGYIYFDKEYVGFLADTTAGGKMVNLSMVVRPMRKITGKKQIESIEHEPYHIKNINYFITDDVNSLSNPDSINNLKLTPYKGLNLYSNENKQGIVVLKEALDYGSSTFKYCWDGIV